MLVVSRRAWLPSVVAPRQDPVLYNPPPLNINYPESAPRPNGGRGAMLSNTNPRLPGPLPAALNRYPIRLPAATPEGLFFFFVRGAPVAP